MRREEEIDRQSTEDYVSEVDCTTMDLTETRKPVTDGYVSEVGSTTMDLADTEDSEIAVDASDVHSDELNPDGEGAYRLGDTMRLEVLKPDRWNPLSAVSTLSFRSVASSHSMLLLIFLILLLVSNRYFGQRVDSVEQQRREETQLLLTDLESKQHVIDQLQQNIERQAESLRTVTETPTLQLQPRAPMPATLEPGQVLLIVASSPSEEEALELAQALELDGYASEVVRGMTGYYGISVGRYPFEQAESMKNALVKSGLAKSAPYQMIDTMIDSYVYP